MSRQNEFDAYIQEQLNKRDTNHNGNRIERGYVTLNNSDDLNHSFKFIKENNRNTNYEEATYEIYIVILN